MKLRRAQSFVILIGATLAAYALVTLLFFGSGSAGISAGFMVPLDHAFYAVLALGIGIWAVQLGGEGMLMLPITFMLMLIIGACTDLNGVQMPASKVMIFASILCFSISVSMAYSKQFLVSVILASATAYFMGSSAMAGLRELASPGFFLFGLVGSTLLILACGVSLGIATMDSFSKLSKRLRDMPAVTSFLSFF